MFIWKTKQKKAWSFYWHGMFLFIIIAIRAHPLDHFGSSTKVNSFLTLLVQNMFTLFLYSEVKKRSEKVNIMQFKRAANYGLARQQSNVYVQ